LAHQGIVDPQIKAGDIIEIDPQNALLWAIYIAAGDVGYWNQKIRQDGQDTPANFNQQRAAVRDMRAAAKMAIDAGLAERQVQLAERIGGMIADVIEVIADGLNLTTKQENKLPDLVRVAIASLEAPGNPVIKPRPKGVLINYKKSEVYEDIEA